MQNVIDFDLLEEYDQLLKDVLEVWRKEKSYSLGDIVKYKGHSLECTTAGTSGTTTLDFTNLDVGDTITDGTVVWTIIEEASGKGIDFYTVGKSYEVGDIVIYSGNIYQCITAHTATSTFDNTKWEEVSKSGIPYYNQDTSYKVDDQVVYDNKIYKCVTAHTSTTIFDDTKWEEISGGGISIWQANTEYKVDDVVIDDNLIWQCVITHTSTSTFDESKWEEISGGGIFAWKSNKNYKVGIMVVYKYCIYMCKVAHTSTSEFDYSKWMIIGGNGNSDFGDYVGHITWQMSLQSNYLKLDGTPLANASNDYDELLKYAQDNNLITADTTDKSLFKYDSGTDVLTLPDYIGLCLQGGNTVEEKEAGLPNITGQINAYRMGGISSGIPSASGVFDIIVSDYGHAIALSNENGAVANIPTFDASRSSSIYGNSTTVQPPAIQLIPQIRYKYSGCVYSTEEQRIGTWIDGKPLYQKTYSGTTPSTFNTDLLIIELNSTDNVEDIRGYVEQSGTLNRLMVNGYHSSALNIYTFAVYQSGVTPGIYMRITDSTTASRPYVITIQYTKTTD